LARGKQGAPDPYAAALRMLARRAYSVAELRRALERKFPQDPGIRDALARLRRLGYLDDKKFAELYASSLARHRAFGRHRLRRELKAKLVDYRHIEPAVRQAYEETNEQELLARVLEKKLRTVRLPVTPGKLSSLCRSLLRHGFAADAIMKAVHARPELRPVAEGVALTELECEAGQG
jgi:regulatory protein